MNSIIEMFLKNQLSTLAAAAGGIMGGVGAQAGYSQPQLAGAVFVLLAVALQFGENYLNKKPATPSISPSK